MITWTAGKDLMKFYSEFYPLLIKTTHSQKVFEGLKLKHLGDYQNLYVQSDTLLLADIFGNFRNKYIEIYEFDSTHFLSAPGFAQQVCLKKTEVELELLTNIDILLDQYQ